MQHVERLDFSKPPNDYLVWFDDGWSCICWGLADGQAINASDDDLTEETAIAAAWAHHKARRDPPGMWIGFDSILPDLIERTPRIGVAIPGLAHMELNAGRARFDSIDGAMLAARAAAWRVYEDAVEVADLLDGENGPAETWPEHCAWPRPLAWTTEQRAEVRQWATSCDFGLPEVLRG